MIDKSKINLKLIEAANAYKSCLLNHNTAMHRKVSEILIFVFQGTREVLFTPHLIRK